MQTFAASKTENFKKPQILIPRANKHGDKIYQTGFQFFEVIFLESSSVKRTDFDHRVWQ